MACFTDQENDPESGLMYYGARYYDPWVGRFLSQDPDLVGPFAGLSFARIGVDPQQFNSFSYARNSPTRYTDPTGAALVSHHKNRSGYTIHYTASSAKKAGITHVGGKPFGGTTGSSTGRSNSVAKTATGASASESQDGGSADIPISGGSPEDRAATSEALSKVLSTEKGGEAAAKVAVSEGRLKPQITLNSNGDNSTDANPDNSISERMNIDPNTPHTVRTTDGVIRATLERKIAHELGHAIFKLEDPANIIQFENPIMRDLDQPRQLP